MAYVKRALSFVLLGMAVVSAVACSPLPRSPAPPECNVTTDPAACRKYFER